MMGSGGTRNEHLSLLFKYIVQLETGISVRCGICNQLAIVVAPAVL